MREQAEAAEVMDDGECADDVMDDFLFDETGARINSDWHAEAAALVGECADCVMGDFVFDETGARINSDWHAEADAEAGAATGEEAIAAAEEPGEAAAAGSGCRRKRQRVVPRSRMIISQAPGTEAGSEGVVRLQPEQPREDKLFSAANYFWLLYAVAPATGQTRVHVGTLAEAGECHAILDAAAEAEADSIVGSNSTYCFAGISAEQPEMLYTRTYCCSCQCCRDPKSVHYEFSRCPNINTVGKWAQQTIHEAGGVSKQQKDKRISTQAFADEMKADHLYAAFASVPEMGGRDYWLLLTKSKAKKAKQAIRVVEGVTIRKDQYYIDAQWYLCTSESQDKKSYTLLDGLVQVPVASIVQEHGLKWDREFRNGENLLSKESHLAIARQNFSNVS